ncbi:MAG: hypothetical protein JO264_16515 [Acidisphaera sp.]|nr:hypothetical protein [Acidisphaera sp.]
MSGAASGMADRYLAVATALGDRLCRDALWDGPRCTWGGAAMEAADGEWTTIWRTAGPSLYEGTAGIALFLARLGRATGAARHLDAAGGAIAQALSRLDSVPPDAALGCYAGRLGIAFAAETVGRLCGAEPLHDEAARLAAQIAQSDLSGHESDVISGLAGAIPVLLALARRWSDASLLAAARRCGEALLGRALQHPRGWSWPASWDAGGPALVGYSHGTAGIAVALLELHAATGDGRFRHAADRAHDYERHWYDPVRRNWPDLRFTGAAPGAEPSFPVFWCHGAAGIALARLRAWAITGDPRLREEAETAIATTADTVDLLAAGAAGDANFSLCHGLAGNADVLLSAAVRLDDAEARRRAFLVGDVGLARHGAAGVWPCGLPNGGETPGLLLGLAGIGYFYLRLHAASAVPSVLLIDSADPAS